MAWLNADTVFDPDSLGLSIVGIAAKLGKHDSGEHQHKMGQLLFTQSGCIRITLSKRLCMLPPTRVVWIPANTKHRAEMKGVVGYRSIYIDTALVKSLPNEVVVLEVNPLLRAVLERIAISPFDTGWQQGPALNLLTVGLDEIRSAHREPMLLRLPADRRLLNFSGDELPPPLNIFATTAGAGEKTISRIFMQETGLSYQQWRQQWRFLKSIELLSERNSISSIASALGFASDSAFVYFFKKMSGSTPRAYIPVSR
ncbi:AraC family transcriptional regulator [Serratia aquatilis]|uniref:Helix-turn-helix domain-containing protein n=1 Tax=Serratia aquatilis TaxID=1737515 RepID=A0ABV6EBM8_9GAMM